MAGKKRKRAPPPPRVPPPPPPSPPKIVRPPLESPPFYHFMDQFLEKSIDTDFVETLEAANTQWENMSKKEKRPYEELSEKERENFALHLSQNEKQLEKDRTEFDNYKKELKKLKYYSEADKDDDACFHRG